MKTYSKEEKEFLKCHSYVEDVIGSHHLRYIISGKENAQTIVFMNGLEIQLIAGASDGGMLAQLYTRKYKDIRALILMATVTLDSEYLEPDRKRPWFGKLLTTAMKIAPWKPVGRLLTGKVNTYYEEESEEEMLYGASFFQMIADDRRNKDKLIHSFRMVGELIHEPLMKTSDFECVRGRILLLQPENDIFSKKINKHLKNYCRNRRCTICGEVTTDHGFYRTTIFQK